MQGGVGIEEEEMRWMSDIGWSGCVERRGRCAEGGEEKERNDIRKGREREKGHDRWWGCRQGRYCVCIYKRDALHIHA